MYLEVLDHHIFSSQQETFIRRRHTAAPLLGVLHHNIFSLQQHSSKVFCSEGDAWGIPN